MNGQSTNSIGSIIKDSIFYLIVGVLIIFSIFIIYAKKNNKQISILGYRAFTVLTGSMVPTINPGDIIIVKEDTIDKIQTGDIISFRVENSDNVVTHRVTDVVNDESLKLITKGDANNVEDRTRITSDTLIGKLSLTIPKVGKIVNFINEKLF
ncbi:MAG: signal peptidase I [Clostridium sp.]|uniref:signal peptidase I n=1 Tax=Clostridium sp. TaxID=1506 RepID=UPI0025BD3519|nr:signal peptidase I [Clostridium sp.]MCF0148276.1 signal peptidase I [Clostridium sp.]